MHRLLRLMRRVVTSALVIWLVSLAVPCVAQELDPPATPATPATPDAREGRGSVFVPGSFVGLFTPVGDRVALNVYGFYYGKVAVPVAQVDVPVRITKFLTVTPSYLYYEVPPSGLDRASAYPARFADTFEENQFRIDGTVKFSIHAFEITDRNMYVRRFLPTGDINRYRQRIGIAHPLTVSGRVWKPFVNYEAFYDRTSSGWNKDRVMTGVTLPLVKRMALQPAYIWDHYRAQGPRDVNYLQIGLIVNTR